ncbi:MAG: HEAT repeat domain-containing protein, partial [Kiritimatiellaceae bacterium]|nr:HEAT repeat domain-containing protein [Kiritimatiellaceae bacterium]
MKKKSFTLLTLLALVVVLGLTGCSRTVEDVARWKAGSSIEKLIKALGDPKMEVRLAATEALSELKAEPAVDSLAALYNDPEDEIILAAVEALASIGSKSITTPMIAALKLDFPQARKTAAVKLGEQKATGAVKQLGEALNDSEADVQLSAAVALGRIGDEGGSEALAGKLGDSSVALRKACVEALGQTGGDVAAEGLIDALADSDAGISKAAIASLVHLKETSVPFALEALRNEKKKIRAESISVLRKLEAIPEDGNNLIWYQLARISVDSEEEIDKGVVHMLAKQGEPAIDTLLEAAAHVVVDFREHAVLALEHIGKP